VIEFVTLLLGLVAGVHTVAVAPDPDAAAVELRLDGATVGRRTEPPWRFVVDLGADLSPHHLEAVAFDARGGDVGRAHQWLNLPREAAEARLTLATDAQGWPVSAGVAWASLWSDQPRTVEIDFDGRPLEVADPSRFELPRYDRGAVHVLAAELAFPHEERARAEASFGGVFGERISTELTAVPVVLPRAPRHLRVRDFRAALVDANGSPLDVVSVEAPGADLVVVRDEASQRALAMAIAAVERRYHRTYLQIPKDLLPLRRGDHCRFVWPSVSRWPHPAGLVLDPGIFPSLPDASIGDGGLPWALDRAARTPLPQRVADAVAVAGVKAAAGGHPRAVVLIVDPATPDRSAFPPEAVRRYLARLHVPLFVWTTAADAGGSLHGWGEVASVAAWPDLQGAVRRLREALDHQAIVWVDGRHLPQTIRLSGTAEGLAIAGANPGRP
jgi:hypothetical protein